MELGTFGALFAFALELERRALALCEAAPMEQAAEAHRLAAGSRRRLGRLERARQEGVSEMILEAISGLHSEDYPLPAAEAGAWTEAAAALEETAARFYRDAAAKVPIAETARLFARLAEENDQRRTELRRNLPDRPSV